MTQDLIAKYNSDSDTEDAPPPPPPQHEFLTRKLSYPTVKSTRLLILCGNRSLLGPIRSA